MFPILMALFATTTPQSQFLPSQPIFPVIEEAQAAEIPPVATSTTPEHIVEIFGDKRMVNVLKCESGLKQFATGTTPLISKTSDVGIAQINQIHWQHAKELGLDIFGSVEDNLKMAKIIYDSEGINAWVCHQLVKDV